MLDTRPKVIAELFRIDFETMDGVIVSSAVTHSFGHKGEIERKAQRLAKQRALQYGIAVRAAKITSLLKPCSN